MLNVDLSLPQVIGVTTYCTARTTTPVPRLSTGFRTLLDVEPVPAINRISGHRVKT